MLKNILSGKNILTFLVIGVTFHRQGDVISTTIATIFGLLWVYYFYFKKMNNNTTTTHTDIDGNILNLGSSITPRKRVLDDISDNMEPFIERAQKFNDRFAELKKFNGEEFQYNENNPDDPLNIRFNEMLEKINSLLEFGYSIQEEWNRLCRISGWYRTGMTADMRNVWKHFKPLIRELEKIKKSFENAKKGKKRTEVKIEKYFQMNCNHCKQSLELNESSQEQIFACPSCGNMIISRNIC